MAEQLGDKDGDFHQHHLQEILYFPTFEHLDAPQVCAVIYLFRVHLDLAACHP